MYFLPIILLVVIFLLGWKKECSVFECGIDIKSRKFWPFPNRFIVLIILFVLFDIELLLVSPAIYINFFLKRYIFIILVIIIIFFGTWLEWHDGIMKWK